MAWASVAGKLLGREAQNWHHFHRPAQPKPSCLEIVFSPCAGFYAKSTSRRGIRAHWVEVAFCFTFCTMWAEGAASGLALAMPVVYTEQDLSRRNYRTLSEATTYYTDYASVSLNMLRSYRCRPIVVCISLISSSQLHHTCTWTNGPFNSTTRTSSPQ